MRVPRPKTYIFNLIKITIKTCKAHRSLTDDMLNKMSLRSDGGSL